MLKNGIYEQIINENINQELIDKNDEKHIEKETVDYAESSKVFAKYVSEIVEKGLDIVKEEEGMRQRANFMRTYVNSNDIMLLDEPFGALDSITKSSMQKWLLDIRKKVTSTILLITHDIEEAILLSDRIYVISNKPSSVSMEIVVDRDRIGDVEYSFKLKKDILDVLHI